MTDFPVDQAQRGAMSTALSLIHHMPDAWLKEDDRLTQDDAYARGIAAGLRIAAGQLREQLNKLDAVTPSCPHDKPLTSTCWDCFG